jgi:hypothetical protein
LREWFGFRRLSTSAKTEQQHNPANYANLKDQAENSLSPSKELKAIPRKLHIRRETHAH